MNPRASAVRVKAPRFMVTAALCFKGSKDRITLAGLFRQHKMIQETCSHIAVIDIMLQVTEK